MRAADFDYPLPAELIAQAPTAERDQCRLLTILRDESGCTHGRFSDLLNYLRPGDAIVLNDSRVIPARLRGVKLDSGGKIEALLTEENARNDWWVMLRPAKRVREGVRLAFHSARDPAKLLEAVAVEKNSDGHVRLRFQAAVDILDLLDQFGEVPLPPYITRPIPNDRSDDRDQYQTVYARPRGSVAAPTAGLHFTESLLAELPRRGVRVCFVTLHVGVGTFAPVKAETVAAHLMHEERFEISQSTADAIAATRAAGGRVFAVGTTTLRALESVAAAHDGRVIAQRGRTNIFIYPPYRFRVVDALVTNFHLPQSTLLMLVSAFVAPGEASGRERILAAYAEAVRERYRFFSYGDAMLII